MVSRKKSPRNVSASVHESVIVGGKMVSGDEIKNGDEMIIQIIWVSSKCYHGALKRRRKEIRV